MDAVGRGLYWGRQQRYQPYDAHGMVLKSAVAGWSERRGTKELVAGRDLVTRGGMTLVGGRVIPRIGIKTLGCASASFVVRLTTAGVYMRFALSPP